MIFPLDSLMTTAREFGLVGAVVIGFFFGFVLERAGFGRANKLAAQFYLTDMTVFKVMFGAIVTAMLGLMVLSGLGLADLTAISESAASTTYMWPMLVGGLLLGVGFIISGYCPGTSLVSAASGNLDGLMTIVGVGVGSLVFGELFPVIAEFYVSGDQGQTFLYQWLEIPAPVLALGIAAIAIGCFFGAEAVERAMARGKTVRPNPKPRRYVFAGLATAAAVGVALLTVNLRPAPAEATRAVGRIEAADLVQRLLDEPWKVMVLDIRPRAAYEEGRIPGSVHRAAAELGDYGLAYSPGVQDLVLVGEQDLGTVPTPALEYRGKVAVLAGGYRAWEAYALETPPAPAADATPAQLSACQLQAAMHAKMTGAAAAPPPPTRSASFSPPKKKKGGGCDG